MRKKPNTEIPPIHLLNWYKPQRESSSTLPKALPFELCWIVAVSMNMTDWVATSLTRPQEDWRIDVLPQPAETSAPSAPDMTAALSHSPSSGPSQCGLRPLGPSQAERPAQPGSGKQHSFRGGTVLSRPQSG